MADARDVEEVLNRGEGPVGLAVTDDALGQRRSDAGQVLKRGGVSGVEVDEAASLRPLRVCWLPVSLPCGSLPAPAAGRLLRPG